MGEQGERQDEEWVHPSWPHKGENRPFLDAHSMLALPMGTTGDYAPKPPPPEPRSWIPYPTVGDNQWMGLPVVEELERWRTEDRQDLTSNKGTYCLGASVEEMKVPRRGVPERALLLVDYPLVEDPPPGRRNEEERLLTEALHGSLQARWPDVPEKANRLAECEGPGVLAWVPALPCTGEDYNYSLSL